MSTTPRRRPDQRTSATHAVCPWCGHGSPRRGAAVATERCPACQGWYWLRTWKPCTYATSPRVECPACGQVVPPGPFDCRPAYHTLADCGAVCPGPPPETVAA